MDNSPLSSAGSGASSSFDLQQIFDVEEDDVQREAKRLKMDAPKSKSLVQPNLQTLRSENYLLFKWCSDGKWQCKLCSSQYKHSLSGGSASLKKHLEKHKKVIEGSGGIRCLAEKLEVSEASGCKLINHVIRSPRQISAPCEKITKEGYKERLVNLIICNDMPAAIVKSESFIEYGAYLSNNSSVCVNPSPPTLTAWIKDSFEEKQKEVSQMLKQNAGKLSFILDCWTSSNQKPFQGVVVCWINKDWESCHTVLDLTPLRGSHTGENLAKAFEDIIDKFKLWKNLLAITTDNASNMDTFFREFEILAKRNLCDFNQKQHRVRCMAHVINLACRDVVKAVLNVKKEDTSNDDSADEDDGDEDLFADEDPKLKKTFLDKIKIAVSKIRSSPQRREYFEAQCKDLQMKPRELIRDCPTRWNSTLAMLRRVLEYRQPFLRTCNFIKRLSRLKLDEDEHIWERIGEMIKLLEPFERATLKLSKGHCPTMSDVISTYQYLFENLETYMNKTDKRLNRTRSKSTMMEHPEWLLKSANAGWDKLVKYYTDCDNSVYIISTVMDPRYKLKYLQTTWASTHFNDAKQKVTNVWLRRYKNCSDADKSEKPGSNSNNNGENSIVANDDIDASAAKKMKDHCKEDDELKRYLSLPNIPISAGVSGALQWWKIHSVSYQNLSKMAMDYLAVPATGVPVERLFSSGPDVLKTKQQRMAPETIRKRIMLKQWVKYKDHLKLDIINEAAESMIEVEVEDDADIETGT